ncbi:MAG TPA: peptidylprolyl isomerase [Planctomycetota bacterium]|nr:peptidylprolyl isomerase [Planctomycetota bacterium]
MVAALVLLLLAAPAPPEIPVRSGAPITLDGRVGEAEWADAFSITREDAREHRVRFRLKRTGPWLALAFEGDQAYLGEVPRLYVTDASGAWITNVILGLGQPALPPALWRRGGARDFDNPDLGPGDCPRACLVRLDLGGEDRWSAEVLLRLGALGIGRGDLRDLRGLFVVHANDPERREVFTLPGGAGDPHDPAQYARLVSPDGWGAGETWAPVAPEQSREFDDAQLLYRLCLEHDKVSQNEAPEQLVIANAVRPRTMSRISALRKEIEDGRARNPTLPAWTYFLGRLLHEANLYDEAEKVIQSIPPPLRANDTFASLAAEHFLDTERFDEALEICRKCPYMRGQAELVKLATSGKTVLEEERAAIAKDEAKEEKNPRVALVTSKGRIVIELFEDDAPGAVRNFMDLVLRRKFYDGLRFHEVEGARLAIVGDPRTRLGSSETKAGPGFRLKKDRSERGLLRGYVAALPLDDGTFHGSEFLLSLAPMLGEMPHTFVFGRVVEGMDVLMSIEQDDLVQEVQVLSRRNHGYEASGARIDR